MIKTVVLSLVFLVSSIGVILLFMIDPGLETILSYFVLALIVLMGLGFWLAMAVGLVCCVWSWMLPHAVLSVDGLVISIHYTRFNRGERMVLTGRTSDYTQMKVARAPITEPIEIVLGERSVNGQGDYPATLRIEDEVFEFPMSKIYSQWSSTLTRTYSGYFHLVKGPVHFVGEVKHAIVHELEISELITIHQNS